MLGRWTQRWLRSLCAAFGMVLLACAYLSAAAAKGFAQPQFLATIGMIADPAERIAESCVEVDALIGPGLDPHLFTPRPSDIARLRQADRVVALGLGLEGRLAEVLARAGALLLGEALAPALLLYDPASGEPDPHVWMDAKRWSATFPLLAAELTALAPDCAKTIAERLTEELALADALHGWITAAVASIPPEKRVLLSAHDAFAYFGDAYGLEVLAIQGISTEAEATLAEIEALASLIAERRIPAVFMETTVNPRPIAALIETAAARGHRPLLGGELLSDSLGHAPPQNTWLGMLVHNTVVIVSALGGEVPPLPEILAGHLGQPTEAGGEGN